MFRKVKEFFARITGFSTPLFGLSWNGNKSCGESNVSPDSELVLTVSECAAIIRLQENTIVQLLESGELGGLLINNEWRVLPEQLISFLSERAKSTQVEILSKQLQDPKTWKKALDKDPALKKVIETEIYPDNSFGRFLQEALKMNEDID